MNTSIFEKGMIFIMQDTCDKTRNNSHHPYLVINKNNEGGSNPLHFVQCMGISSMHDKCIDLELPILLCNNKVSYVVPYNIYSFESSKFELKNFKGCITDAPYSSKNKFMSLLMKVYLFTLGQVQTDVREEVKKYREMFWKAHPEAEEYRVVYSKREKEGEKEKTNIHENKSSHQLSSQKPKNKVLTIDDMKRFNNYKRKLISQWSDQDLIDFVIGFKKFGYGQIHTVMPDVLKSYSSMYNKNTQCKEELAKRGIKL